MNRKFILVLIAFLLVADGLIVGLVFWIVKDLEEPVLLPEREAELRREIANKNEELQRFREEIADLRERNATRKAMADTPQETPAGATAAGPDGITKSVPGAGAGAETPEEEAKEGGSKKAATYASFAKMVLTMAKLMKENGNKATPELMRLVSKMMEDTAALQAKYGFDEPGYVTESPEFKAHFLIGALDETDTPLTPAEKARLLDDANRAMGPYLEAAQGRSGDFALEKTARVLEKIGDFGDSVSKMMEGRSLEGLPFSDTGKEVDGSGRNSPWPCQSCTGVQDLEGAVESLTRRWTRRMGIPEGEVPSLQGLVRDFVHRSHDARLRYGSGAERKLSPTDRKALDREIAAFEIEALRRIHGSLNLDEKTRERVANYQSLDRFEIGGTESWSESGSIGNFVVSSGEDHEEERSEEGEGGK
ncbi:MAG: hypothetical protein ACYS47_05070 [Planctomycetota bacterium]|jgi:hypothetical protein